ncbi:unnamed protein product [Ectocarpus sp. 12 AP-2014]
MPTLLRHGAIASTCDDLGLTPLHQVYFRKYPGLEWNMDLLLRWGANETALDSNGETSATKLDELPPAGISCSLADVERVRLSLARAPADRAWRRRCWLVILRSRYTKAGANGYDIGGETRGYSNQAGGHPGKSLKNDNTDGKGALRHHHDINGQPCKDGGKVGTGGGAKRAGLSGIVTFLVDLEVKDAFRTVVGFM